MSAALLVTSACGDSTGMQPLGSSNEAVNISSAPLSGMVGGEPWVIGAADTDSFLSEGDTFWVDAYETTLAACSGGFDAEGNSMILTVPKTPGTYPLSPTFTQTFVSVDDDLTTNNLGATDGTLVVTEVTDSEVRVSARIMFDADNTVEGTFTANICP